MSKRVPQKKAERFEAREVKRVDGWETSDGKVWDHPVKAAAIQAELDLFRLVFHYIDVEEAMDGSEEDAKRVVRELFKNYRDDLAALSRAAYMTPDELGEAMDKHAGASGQAPLSPNMQDAAREICKVLFNAGWSYRDRWRREITQEQAFEKWFRIANTGDLRRVVDRVIDLVRPPRDAHTSINADADDAASGLKRPDGEALTGHRKDIKVTATPCNGVNMPLDHHSVAYSLSNAEVPFAAIGEAVWKAVQNTQRLDKLSAFDFGFCVLVSFENLSGVRDRL